MKKLGYIFKFDGHGSFDPDGKIKGEMSQEEIKAHNAKLAQAEAYAMIDEGKGTLYLSDNKAGSWDGSISYPVRNVRKSRNNFGAERTDVDFYITGRRWHGVNLGDNQILRVKRCKS